MKIFLKNQSRNLNYHLEQLKSKGVMKYDRNKLVEKITEIEFKSTKTLNQINLDFLSNYKIFPSNILLSKTQWETENRNMQIGDSIIQQAFFPPLKIFSQKVVFGVRISEIINEENRKGFSYETIEGHVEKGISIFTIEEEKEKLKFKIHTFSEPGNWLTKLLGPIITIPYQKYCTQKAMEFVKLQVENQ